MFYTEFVSASRVHIDWLRSEIKERCGISGHITKCGKQSTSQLKYAKKESLVLLKRMYYSKKVTHLARKKLKINQMLAIVGEKV